MAKTAASILLSLLLTATANAKTSSTVSVAVLGQGGRTVTRRTTEASASSSLTTADAVAGYWTALHEFPRDMPKGNLSTTARRKALSKIKDVHQVQEPGMSLVPDMFERPDGGVAVFLMAGDEKQAEALEAQPNIAKLNQERVGSFKLMEFEKVSDLVDVFPSKAMRESGDELEDVVNNSMVGVKIQVDDVKDVDERVGKIISELQAREGTYVMHLVVDHGVEDRRRRLSAEENDRNLEEENGNEGEGEDNGDDNFKSMYDIQYFNVILWTALGLITILFYTIGLMINMPLMADTLLFGESAKMVAG